MSELSPPERGHETTPWPSDGLIERAAATILPYEIESMLRHNWTDEGIATVKRYMARGVLMTLLAPAPPFPLIEDAIEAAIDAIRDSEQWEYSPAVEYAAAVAARAMYDSLIPAVEVRAQ